MALALGQRLLGALTPRRGILAETGVAYYRQPRHQLDIYRPVARQQSPLPVVVFFYGGRWQRGDRSVYSFAGRALAATGCVAVVADYRLWPEVRFAGFMDDGARAVSWVQRNIGDFGGDPARIYLMGHSAGAHIAGMLALAPQWLDSAGGDRARLAGWVGLSGPYDFLPVRDDDLIDMFTRESPPEHTQPIHFADASAPPALLLTGARDRMVGPGNSRRLARRLEAEKPGRVRVIHYPRVGHLGILAGLTSPGQRLAPLLTHVPAFVQDPAGFITRGEREF